MSPPVKQPFQVRTVSAKATETLRGTPRCYRLTLNHELRDNPVEDGAFVAKSLLVCAKLSEVLCGLGHHIPKKSHDDSASGFSADGDVKVHLETTGAINAVARHQQRQGPSKVLLATGCRAVSMRKSRFSAEGQMSPASASATGYDGCLGAEGARRSCRAKIMPRKICQKIHADLERYVAVSHVLR